MTPTPRPKRLSAARHGRIIEKLPTLYQLERDGDLGAGAQAWVEQGLDMLIKFGRRNRRNARDRARRRAKKGGRRG